MPDNSSFSSPRPLSQPLSKLVAKLDAAGAPMDGEFTAPVKAAEVNPNKVLTQPRESAMGQAQGLKPLPPGPSTQLAAAKPEAFTHGEVKGPQLAPEARLAQLIDQRFGEVEKRLFNVESGLSLLADDMLKLRPIVKRPRPPPK